MKFSDYVSINKLKLLQQNDVEVKKIMTRWVQSIDEQCHPLELCEEYQECFAISISDIEIPEKLNSRADVDKLILTLDALYDYHVKVLQNQLRLESREAPICDHGLDAVECDKENGVKAQLYYVTGPNQRTQISGVMMSGLGTDNDEKLRLAKFINDGFNKLGFDPECRKHLRAHLEDNNHYHAEELLFVTFYEKIMAFLDSLKKKNHILSFDEHKQKAFDFQWMYHLKSYPRLEFNISTSPCEHCRYLFKSFRDNLNKLGIHIPIIINYTNPCLTEEINASKILVVAFNGSVIPTDVYLKTEYDHKVLRQVTDYVREQNIFNTCDLDISGYGAIQAMLKKADNLPKIIDGLNASINGKTPSADLAWIKSFVYCIPQFLLQKKYFPSINKLESKIKGLFDPFKIIPLAKNTPRLATDLDDNIALWLDPKKGAVTKLGYFAKEEKVKPIEQNLSSGFKLTFIIATLSILFIMLKTMPTVLNSGKLGKN